MQDHRSILETPEARSRALIDQGLLLLGDALKDRLEPQLVGVFGPDWSAHVRPRRGRFARRDLASYAQCLLGEGDLRDTRHVFRAGLGVDISRTADRAIRGALQVRNRFAHPDRPADVRETHWDVGQLLVLARVLDLDCLDGLRVIAREAEALSRGANGIIPSLQEIQELRERADQAKAEAQRFRDAAAQTDAERERTHDQLVRTEDALRAALALRDGLHDEAESLRRQLEEATADSARADDLAQQLAAAEEQLAHQSELLAAAEEQQAALEERLETQDRTVDEAERRSQQAVADREAMAGTVAFGEALVEVRDSGDGLLEELRGLLAELTEADEARPEEADDAFPAPGQPWPYPRGDSVWKLSRAKRSLVSYDEDQISLHEVCPEPFASRFVDSFLKVRPEGGRVWVDEDSDAATYVNGTLTYLGRLRWEPAVAEFDDPPVGTPYSPSGRRYTVTTSGIQRAADHVWLASAIDDDLAAAVLERLLAVRPSGGKYRVDPTGAATTYLRGRWVFAGRISPHEWFPGDVTVQ